MGDWEERCLYRLVLLLQRKVCFRMPLELHVLVFDLKHGVTSIIGTSFRDQGGGRWPKPPWPKPPWHFDQTRRGCSASRLRGKEPYQVIKTGGAVMRKRRGRFVLGVVRSCASIQSVACNNLFASILKRAMQKASFPSCNTGKIDPSVGLHNAEILVPLRRRSIPILHLTYVCICI